MLKLFIFLNETNWDINYNLFSPCSHGPNRFPKQIVKLEFVKKKFTVFVLLYDFVYAMHAPVVIQYKYIIN